MLCAPLVNADSSHGKQSESAESRLNAENQSTNLAARRSKIPHTRLDKKIKLILVYRMTTGRNLDEVLRVIDSLQLTANKKVATPAQWKQGDDVIIAGSVSDDDAKDLFRTAGRRRCLICGL